ncbi:MAG TPA: glycerophosphodiester phosphodiesterase family protein [Actinophytocola sp.]|uniref:glycerophosphodiester phosphodiesterase family protein n=1 Tax=Actinophytocola sp. TaxID=1872138 RepID=UPI002DDDA09A|nr:glycerophosphodiester phosphodiesterase family protein [Actinophytocola sp.]HEV2781480.1 glycerophosphodiester phosphodiesterase family protein [Actinophytocola sp.]
MLPDVVAHRGASAHRAEHTLAAYALALEQGADGLECDVRLTRDGHLVCHHDRRVDRTSSGRGVVSTLSLERMAELDYGGWHAEPPEHADDLVLTHRTAKPERLLTLEALLALVVDTGARLFVETKHPVRYAGLVEAKLIALLRRYGLAAPPSKEESPVVVMSFSARAVGRVRRHSATLPTVLLLGPLARLRRDATLPPAADYAGPSIEALRADPDYVARTADRGHDTYCWTVDDAADILLCQRIGVRFLATNAPGATRAILDGGAAGNVAAR